MGNEILVMSLSFNDWAISPSQEWGFIVRPYFLLSLSVSRLQMQQDQPVPASFTPLACLLPCLHFHHGLYSLNCKLKWPFAPWSCFLSGVCHRQEKQQRPQCPRGPEKSPQLTCFHKNSFRRHLAKMCGKAPLTHKLHPQGFQGGRQKMWGSGDLCGCMAPSSEQLFIHLYSTWTQPRPSCPRKPSKRYRLLLGTGEWEGESHPWDPVWHSCAVLGTQAWLHCVSAEGGCWVGEGFICIHEERLLFYTHTFVFLNEDDLGKSACC